MAAFLRPTASPGKPRPSSITGPERLRKIARSRKEGTDELKDVQNDGGSRPDSTEAGTGTIGKFYRSLREEAQKERNSE